jgi:hypothetical protein
MTKKVKRTISLIIAAIMLLSTMSVLAFAGSYAEATSKEVGPHDCVAGPEVEDEKAYAQPTCTKAGKKEFVINCTICDKELSRRAEYLPKLTSHVPADTFTIEDVKQPTCAKYGEYYEVTRCKFCNKIIEKKLVKVNPTTAHVAGIPVQENIIPATCAAVGSYDSVIRCKVCGLVLQRTFKEIPKLTYHVSETSLRRNITLNGTTARVTFLVDMTDPDNIVLFRSNKKNGAGLPYIEKPASGIVTGTVAAGKFANAAYVDFNTGDLIGTTRTCADGEERCAICGELLQPAIPHVWDKGVVTVRPTATSQGIIEYTCLIKGCDAYKEERLAPVFPSEVKGDLNGDEVVTVAEARFILRYAVGLGNFDNRITNLNFANADYDDNGKVEPADARMTLRAAVRLPN